MNNSYSINNQDNNEITQFSVEEYSTGDWCDFVETNLDDENFSIIKADIENVVNQHVDIFKDYVDGYKELYDWCKDYWLVNFSARFDEKRNCFISNIGKYSLFAIDVHIKFLVDAEVARDGSYITFKFCGSDKRSELEYIDYSISQNISNSIRFIDKKFCQIIADFINALFINANLSYKDFYFAEVLESKSDYIVSGEDEDNENDECYFLSYDGRKLTQDERQKYIENFGKKVHQSIDYINSHYFEINYDSILETDIQKEVKFKKQPICDCFFEGKIYKCKLKYITYWFYSDERYQGSRIEFYFNNSVQFLDIIYKYYQDSFLELISTTGESYDHCLDNKEIRIANKNICVAIADIINEFIGEEKVSYRDFFFWQNVDESAVVDYVISRDADKEEDISDVDFTEESDGSYFMKYRGQDINSEEYANLQSSFENKFLNLLRELIKCGYDINLDNINYILESGRCYMYTTLTDNMKSGIKIMRIRTEANFNKEYANSYLAFDIYDSRGGGMLYTITYEIFTDNVHVEKIPDKKLSIDIANAINEYADIDMFTYKDFYAGSETDEDIVESVDYTISTEESSCDLSNSDELQESTENYIIDDAEEFDFSDYESGDYMNLDCVPKDENEVNIIKTDIFTNFNTELDIINNYLNTEFKDHNTVSDNRIYCIGRDSVGQIRPTKARVYGNTIVYAYIAFIRFQHNFQVYDPKFDAININFKYEDEEHKAITRRMTYYRDGEFDCGIKLYDKQLCVIIANMINRMFANNVVSYKDIYVNQELLENKSDYIIGNNSEFDFSTYESGDFMLPECIVNTEFEKNIVTDDIKNVFEKCVDNFNVATGSKFRWPHMTDIDNCYCKFVSDNKGAKRYNLVFRGTQISDSVIRYIFFEYGFSEYRAKFTKVTFELRGGDLLLQTKLYFDFAKNKFAAHDYQDIDLKFYNKEICIAIANFVNEIAGTNVADYRDIYVDNGKVLESKTDYVIDSEQDAIEFADYESGDYMSYIGNYKAFTDLKNRFIVLNDLRRVTNVALEDIKKYGLECTKISGDIYDEYMTVVSHDNTDIYYNLCINGTDSDFFGLDTILVYYEFVPWGSISPFYLKFQFSMFVGDKHKYTYILYDFKENKFRNQDDLPVRSPDKNLCLGITDFVNILAGTSIVNYRDLYIQMNESVDNYVLNDSDEDAIDFSDYESGDYMSYIGNYEVFTDLNNRTTVLNDIGTITTSAIEGAKKYGIDCTNQISVNMFHDYMTVLAENKSKKQYTLYINGNNDHLYKLSSIYVFYDFSSEEYVDPFHMNFQFVKKRETLTIYYDFKENKFKCSGDSIIRISDKELCIAIAELVNTLAGGSIVNYRELYVQVNESVDNYTLNDSEDAIEFSDYESGDYMSYIGNSVVFNDIENREIILNDLKTVTKVAIENVRKYGIYCTDTSEHIYDEYMTIVSYNNDKTYYKLYNGDTSNFSELYSILISYDFTPDSSTSPFYLNFQFKGNKYKHLFIQYDFKENKFSYLEEPVRSTDKNLCMGIADFVNILAGSSLVDYRELYVQVNESVDNYVLNDSDEDTMFDFTKYESGDFTNVNCNPVDDYGRKQVRYDIINLAQEATLALNFDMSTRFDSGELSMFDEEYFVYRFRNASTKKWPVYTYEYKEAMLSRIVIEYYYDHNTNRVSYGMSFVFSNYTQSVLDESVFFDMSKSVYGIYVKFIRVCDKRLSMAIANFINTVMGSNIVDYREIYKPYKNIVEDNANYITNDWESYDFSNYESGDFMLDECIPSTDEELNIIANDIFDRYKKETAVVSEKFGVSLKSDFEIKNFSIYCNSYFNENSHLKGLKLHKSHIYDDDPLVYLKGTYLCYNNNKNYYIIFEFSDKDRNMTSYIMYKFVGDLSVAIKFYDREICKSLASFINNIVGENVVNYQDFFVNPDDEEAKSDIYIRLD